VETLAAIVDRGESCFYLKEMAMKAVWYERQGSIEVLEYGEIAEPMVGSGEVMVRVAASAVNPSDTKKRSGWGGMKMGFERIIPHQDGAGEIVALGDGVSDRQIGERVWIYEGQLGRAMGTAAEYIAIPATRAIPLPDLISFEAGACLGVPAMTSHRAVFADGAVQDLVLLVTGGGGAVGNYAIQWAKWGGAKVLTTVSRPAQGEAAIAAGADAVIDYRQEDVVARIQEITGRERGVDRVIDVNFAANWPVADRVLRTNGVIALYAAEPDDRPALPIRSWLDRNIVMRSILVYTMPMAAKQAAIRDLITVLEQDIFRHPIAQRFPLSEIAAAHELLESGGAIGKVIIDIAQLRQN
jgi:NADPH:quinone reductase